MPNIRWLLRLITRLHVAVYRATGGRLGGNLAGIRVLLLTTVGRRSGAARSLPLLYVENEKGYVVVASNAGDDRHPHWWLNLLGRPDAQVQAGRARCAVHARRATPAEEAELWPELVAAYAAYARYRERASREIPVVLLERIAP